MGSGNHWIYQAQAQSGMEGAPGVTPRGCCVIGQDLGLALPQGCGVNRHFLLGFAVFPGSCSVPALPLSNEKGHSCTWDGAVFIFFLGAVISASPQDRISALSSEKKTLGRGGAGKALCQRVSQCSVFPCAPNSAWLLPLHSQGAVGR